MIRCWWLRLLSIWEHSLVFNATISSCLVSYCLLQHLQGPLYDCQVFIEKLVNFLEVMSNIWNFSDVRASAVFYGFLGAFVVFSTLIMNIFSVSQSTLGSCSLFILSSDYQTGFLSTWHVSFFFVILSFRFVCLCLCLSMTVDWLPSIYDWSDWPSQTRLLFFLVGGTLLLLNSLRDVFPELFSLEKLYEMLTSEEHGAYMSSRFLTCCFFRFRVLLFFKLADCKFIY